MRRRAAGAAAAAGGVQAAGGAARAVGQGRHARGRCFRPPGVGAALGCALCLGVLPCSPTPVWLAMCTAWMHDMCGGPCRWLPCCQTTSSQAHGHAALASELGNRADSLMATQLSHQLDSRYLPHRRGHHSAPGPRKAGEGTEPEQQGIISFCMLPQGCAPCGQAL